MLINQASSRLVEAAASIARMDPEGWGRFIEAVRDYSQAQTEALVASPAANLPVAQGRAQIARDIHGLLADCMRLADAYERKL